MMSANEVRARIPERLAENDGTDRAYAGICKGPWTVRRASCAYDDMVASLHVSHVQSPLKMQKNTCPCPWLALGWLLDSWLLACHCLTWLAIGCAADARACVTSHACTPMRSHPWPLWHSLFPSSYKA